MIERRESLIAKQVGQRLDKALAMRLPDLSRAQIQRLISDGDITVDGSIVKPSLRLAGGEQIEVRIPISEPTELVAEPIPLDVRYEDEDLIVVNKPAGMVVHPAPGHPQGTLVNAILAYCPDIEGVGGERRPGIVHRLDKETSGLILVAKNDQAMRHLQRQFKQRKVDKRYTALVHGRFGQVQILIDAPVGRDPHNRKRMAVISPGSNARARSAQTHVRLVDYYRNSSLLRCQPITGRTHQIRVHLAFAGHPVVGDKLYGQRRPKLLHRRHFLHAGELTILHPTGEKPLTIEAPLPPELRRLLDELAD
ncbi:MAG: RluA family pseudouridine synthase [Candidatus Promineifilaceae bacterium]|nr:RluA family pseudouridine synthase [Candidatus Promineifilaceae bacterium]